MIDEKLTKIEETEAYETVQIPKVTADFIEKQPFFKLYESVDSFVMEAIRLYLQELKLTAKKPTSELKKDLDLKMIPVKIELCKPFYDFIDGYRQYFGSQYTVELICMSMIYSQVKRLFNELDGFARKKDSFLDKSDYFKKHMHLGLVSFDDPEDEE
ncbi:hypothetical protein KAS24_03280 [Candidatus Bathyarchaeota archaeon]|nr:hypothetical protein [Candidatus Bathyarchaeota archaeon]